MQLIRAFLILCLLVLSASAATYYIDFNAANDSANGTTTATPWKRCPGMVGFAGSYSHSAGDRFIFKGGVTWTSGVFPLTVANSGTLGSYDYYGVDSAYYTGGAWTRPVFDGEQTYGPARLIYVSGKSCLTFDSLDIKRHQALWNSDGGTFGAYTVLLYGDTASITITNCWIRDWSATMPRPAGSNNDDGNSGGLLVLENTGFGTNMLFIDNLFTQSNSPSGNRMGVALKGNGTIFRNVFSSVCDAVVGGGTVVSNLFINIDDATDPDQHEDVLYCTGIATVVANVISNTAASAPTIYLEPNRGSASGTTLVYNNVVMNSGYYPLSVDMGGSYPGSNFVVKIFNNTVYSSGTSMRVVDRGGGDTALGQLMMTNNVFFTDASAATIPSGTVSTNNSGNNITNTLANAAAAGATLANGMQITNAAFAGVGAGTVLSSIFTTDRLNVTRGATWDIGAYEYAAGGDVTAPTCAITSPASVSSGGSGSYSTSSSTITVSGTSDDATATVTWSNSRGGSGTATGSTSWSQSGITLASGGNVLSFTATDGSGNATVTTLTVLYTPPDTSGWTTNNVRNLRIGRWQSPFLGVQYLQTQNTSAQRTLMSSVPASYVSLPITYAILTGGSYGGYANGTNYYDAQYAMNTNSGWNVVLQFSDMPTNLIATYVPYLVARYPAWMVVPINENDSAAESSATIKLFRAALPSQRLGGPALYHIVNPPYIDALVASNAFQLLDSFVAHDYLAVPLNGLCTDGWWTNTYYHPSNTPTGYHPEWSVGNLPSRLAWMNDYTNQLRTNFTDTPKAILSEYGIFQNDAPDGDYAGRTFRAMNIPVFVTANYAGTNSCPYNNALYNADGVGYFTPSQRAFLNAIQE